MSEDHFEAALDRARARARRSYEEDRQLFEELGRSGDEPELRVRDHRYNGVAPSIDRVQIDADRRVWIRRYVMPGDDTKHWTVWHAGREVFAVELSASESLMDARANLVLLRVRDALGVDRALIREVVLGNR